MKNFNFKKMNTKLIDGLAHYHMGPESDSIDLNSYLGRELKIHFKKLITCGHCKIPIKKTYSGGYCYPCSAKLAECDICILKPELCHYAKGTCRVPSWGELNCLVPHIIYLANSSGLKVGITRSTQVPTRWIDQGAVAALPVLKVSTRYQSGIFEKLFASVVNDKTDWRKMLKGNIEEIDLLEKRNELYDYFGEAIDRLENEFGSAQVEILENSSVTTINYPVMEYPEKVTSLSLDKNEVVGGTLLGIKGQYLIFNTGVINIRTHTGYNIDLEY
jgi:hypothetical protein